MTERLKEGVQTLLMLNIFPLRGARAEGPSAVSCNRTSLFVSAQGSLRAINGTQYPLCMELVSVSLETDKHIIHKCQTVYVCSTTWWREGKRILGSQYNSHSHALPVVGITERKSITGSAWQTLSCITVLNSDLSKEKYSWVDI